MSPTKPAGLRPGRLFRSSELSRLDDDGRATLRRLGITDVADLRAAREVARRGPGLVPDGVEVHLLRRSPIWAITTTVTVKRRTSTHFGRC